MEKFVSINGAGVSMTFKRRQRNGLASISKKNTHGSRATDICKYDVQQGVVLPFYGAPSGSAVLIFHRE